MKAKELNVELYFYGGALREPDPLNNTTLTVNDEQVWPGDELFSPAALQVGDEVALDIPSGQLTVTVYEIGDGENYIRVFGEGMWEGKAGGLKGGLSGCCDFDVLEYGTAIESSTLKPDQEVPYWLYEDVRSAASFAGQEKQEAMKRMFEVLIDLTE